MKSAWRPLAAIIPVGAIVLVSMLLVLGLGTLGLQNADTYEIERERDQLGNAFRAAAEQVGWELTPQVYWQEAFNQVSAGNADWIDKNQNTYLYELFGYTRIYTLDANDQPISAFENGAEAPSAAFGAVASSVVGPVRDIRQHSDSSPEVVGRIVQEKVAQDGTKLRLVIVGQLEAVAGEPSIVAAATILPDVDATGFDGKPPILIVVKALDDAFIARISHEFGFAGLKWGAETSDGRATYRITGASGGLVGMLSWIPDKPGDTFFRQITPALITALLVLLLAATIAVLAMRRFVAAESESRSKSAFLATMSHEIRTPLNGIVGMVDLLDGPDLTSDQRSKLSIIRECSDALLALINDILDLAKIESGLIELDPRDFDLSDAVDAVMHIAGTRARPKGLALIATYPLRRIHTDETRLRQILLNIVGNAVKFTETGDIRVDVVELDTRNGVDWLRFAVADSGIGIAPDRRHRLFHEFSQVDAGIIRRFGGSGLGLAICARLTTALGGEIGVDSEAGKGSTFWFTLPVGAPLALPRPAEQNQKRIGLASPSPAAREQLALSLARAGHLAEENSSAFHSADLILVDVRCVGADALELSDADLRRTLVFGFGASVYAGTAGRVLDGPLTSRLIAEALAGAPSERRARPRDHGPRSGRVLLVEDNRINQQVAAGLLERMGLTVEIARDGRQALDRVAAGGLDIVLMDMQMPVMDGLEATRRIRALDSRQARVPIIGLTANAFASDKQACLDAGMDGFVAKPINRQKLEGIVDLWLPRETVKEGAGASVLGDRTDRPDPHTNADEANLGMLVDAGQQASLRDEIGQDVWDTLIAVFWNDADALIAAIKSEAIEPEAIQRALHTLKGTAETMGFAEIARLAAVAEGEFRRTGHRDIAAIEQSIGRTRGLGGEAIKQPSGTAGSSQAA